jgi:hypothetical protein
MENFLFPEQGRCKTTVRCAIWSVVTNGPSARDVTLIHRKFAKWLASNSTFDEWAGWSIDGSPWAAGELKCASHTCPEFFVNFKRKWP